MAEEDQPVTRYAPFPLPNALTKNKHMIENPFLLLQGVIVNVRTHDQAIIAESAGACCVCLLHPPSADNSTLTPPENNLLGLIRNTLVIPVMVNTRVGHLVEARAFEFKGADYINENETLGVADEIQFIDKNTFKVPFMSGCRDLAKALRLISEGAVLLRIQGGPNLAKTVESVKKVNQELEELKRMDDAQLSAFAENIKVPLDLVVYTKLLGKLPVHTFASGGIDTPEDAAWMMTLGCNGVFIGVNVFERFGREDAYARLRSVVRATRRYKEIREVAEASSNIGSGGRFAAEEHTLHES